MNKVSNKTIKMYYGESLNFMYTPPDYCFTPDDEVTLTIKRRLRDNRPIMQCKIDEICGNTIHVNIPAYEMEKLPVGGYVYNIIVENNYIKWVIVPPSKLIIKEV